MRILITGAAGFIGYHLAKFLISDSNNWILGIDNLNDYYDVNLKIARLQDLGISNPFEKSQRYQSDKFHKLYFEKADISDRETLNRIFESGEFDIVIHLAAQAGVRYSLVNPYAYSESNLSGFLNILENVREYNIKHLVFASSSSVYGNTKEVPFDENQFVNRPVSLYAATKVANELMAYSYSHLYNIPISGLRFFTVYGPFGRPDMAYFSFSKAIINDKSIKVFNNGNLRRDFTYIDDITKSISLLLDKPPLSDPPYDIYNIGNSKPVNLMDFINLIEKNLNKETEKELLPMQPGDVYETYADTKKLEDKIGFSPQVELEEGLDKFIRWFKSFYKV